MERLNEWQLLPEQMQTLLELTQQVRHGQVGPRLMDLVVLRASQLNGCAYCMDMHSGHLREGGESQRRLDVLPAWRESGLFDAREGAALAWAEAVTMLPRGHAPEDVYAELARHFTPRQVAELTLAVALVNAWNRLVVAHRRPLPQAA
jgi:AhpD family alkylhydroperoxidase